MADLVQIVAEHITFHFGIPCDADLAEAIIEYPKLKPLFVIVEESLANVKEEARWLRQMDNHGHDHGDSYFKNPYMDWAWCKVQSHDDEYDPEVSLMELQAAWDGGDLSKVSDMRDRTSWRNKSGVHVPSGDELRKRGLSDVVRFEIMAEAIFHRNPLEYLRNEAGSIVSEYKLFKSFYCEEQVTKPLPDEYFSSLLTDKP